MSDDLTIWDHITEDSSSWLGRARIRWYNLKGSVAAKLSDLWVWAKANPEIAGPTLFVLVTLPMGTWVFYQADKKEAEEKAALEAKRASTLVSHSVASKKHWEEWRKTFVPSSAKFVCYHGDDHMTWDGKGRMDYRISCNIQDGKAEYSATCDERHCYKGTPLDKKSVEADMTLAQRKQEYGRKASVHWKEWHEKILKGAPAVCYHGDNLANYKEDKAEPVYRISCRVGSTDKVVVCDQNHCEENKGK